jgi:hypothetical protein
MDTNIEYSKGYTQALSDLLEGEFPVIHIRIGGEMVECIRGEYIAAAVQRLIEDGDVRVQCEGCEGCRR